MLKIDCFKAIFVLAVIFILSGCDNYQKKSLTVSAAASMTDVLTEIAQLYENANNNTEILLNFAGSGSVVTQIKEGAPVDVFVSAANRPVQDLDARGLLISDTIETVAKNKIILITPSGEENIVKSFNDLAKASVERIAVGDPATAPVGVYSREIFENLGITEEVADKLIMGTDARAVLNWVSSGEADCGIVYQTDALSNEKIQIICQAPDGSHSSVEYLGSVVTASKNIPDAKTFLNFLKSKEAREIFKKYGFE